jgi:hypothetical protein
LIDCEKFNRIDLGKCRDGQSAIPVQWMATTASAAAGYGTLRLPRQRFVDKAT